MQALHNLSLREKVILIVAFVALLGLSFHALVWEPLMLESVELKEQLEQEQDDLEWMQHNITRLNQSNVKHKVMTGSFVSWVDLVLKKHQLKPSLKRIKPKGDIEVKIWLEQANVTQLMHFLGEVTQYSISIDAIKMSALDEPGLTNANLVLVKQ